MALRPERRRVPVAGGRLRGALRGRGAELLHARLPQRGAPFWPGARRHDGASLLPRPGSPGWPPPWHSGASSWAGPRAPPQMADVRALAASSCCRGAGRDAAGGDRRRRAARRVHASRATRPRTSSRRSRGQGVLARSLPGLDWVRVSLGYWLSDADLDRLAAALRSSRERRASSRSRRTTADARAGRLSDGARRHRDTGVHARRHARDRQGRRPARARAARRAGHPRQHLPPALPPGRGAHRGARRAAPVHGLGAGHAHGFRWFPGIFSRRDAPDRRRRRDLPLGLRRLESRASRPSSRWPCRRRSAPTSPWRSTSARRRARRAPTWSGRSSAPSRWAERCVAAPRPDGQLRFGIVQGGTDRESARALRAQLTALPFEGFAIGGLSVGEEREVMFDVDGLDRGAAAGRRGRATSWASATPRASCA